MFEWLSSFMMNPALAVGTSAVASPILIHLLSKRRFRRVRWAAMEFLLEAQHKNRRRIKLEQWILLFLRCLAVFLIAMLICRPFVRPGALAAILGAAPRTERIILLDDSYSTAYQPASGGSATGLSVFARAKEATERLADWIADESPRDSLTLLVTSRPDEPSLALAGLTGERLQRLREHLSTLNPSQTVARLPEGIGALADLVRGSPTQVNTAVYVISDFQRKDWILPASPSDDPTPSVLAPLAALQSEGASLKCVLINVGDARANNVAITDLVTGHPRVVAGVPARFEVTVSNFSNQRYDQVELSVSVARYRLPPVVIPRLEARQRVRQPIEVAFSQDGSEFIQVELAGAALNEDALQLDDTRALAIEVVPAVQVLIVDGEGSDDPYRDEVFLLRTALRPEGRAASGNELTIIDEQELDELELGDFHVIVLANVHQLSKPARERLERFVAEGGGLILFAGDLVDVEHYNDALYRKGTGLLPLPLGEVAAMPPGVDAIPFASWDEDHPMMRAFVDELAEVFRQVRVFAYIVVRESSIEASDADRSPDRTASPGIDNAGATTGDNASPLSGASAAERAPHRVIARFGDANASPAIVQRQYGRGLSVFVATSADQEWNDWASNFSYLPMLLELVQYVAKPSSAVAQVVADEVVTCPLDTSLFKRTARLRSPGYPVEPEFIIEAEEQAEATVLLFGGTNRVGIYRFLLSSVTGESVTRYAAVNPDPTESDLTPAGRLELDEALTDIPFEYVDGLGVLAGRSHESKREFWWPLLLTAFFVLMTEHTLAWWFGTRG